MNATTTRLLLLPLLCLALTACGDRPDGDDALDIDTVAWEQEEPGGLTPGERMEQEERERMEREREIEEERDEEDSVEEEKPTPRTFARYTNPQFHYTLLYPTTLRPQAESDNGRRFVSADGDIVMTAHGRYLLQQEQIRDLYAARRAELGGEVTYTVVRNGFYVISGRENGTIFYEKTLKHVGVAATVILRYPASRKKELDPIVTTVAGSFRLGDEE